MRYATECAVKNVVRNKFFTALNVVALTVSFFFPVIILAAANSIFMADFFSVPANLDRVGGMAIIGEHHAILDSDLVREAVPEIEFIASSTRERSIFLANNRTSFGELRSFGIEFSDILRPYMVSGRHFTQSDFDKGARNAVITSNLYSSLGGNVETVRVGGVDFNVIGIVNNTRFIGGSVFIPSTIHYEITGEIPTFYEIQLRQGYSFRNDGSNVVSRLAGSFGIDSYFGADAYSVFAESGYNVAAIIVLVVTSLAVLAYSILNVTSVLIAKYENESKAMKIRLLIGASKSAIKRQVFITLLIYVFIAIVLNAGLIAVSMPLFSNLQRIGIFLDINVAVILIALFVAIFTALIVSSRIVSKLFKKQFSN